MGCCTNSECVCVSHSVHCVFITTCRGEAEVYPLFNGACVLTAGRDAFHGEDAEPFTTGSLQTPSDKRQSNFNLSRYLPLTHWKKDRKSGVSLGCVFLLLFQKEPEHLVKEKEMRRRRRRKKRRRNEGWDGPLTPTQSLLFIPFNQNPSV